MWLTEISTKNYRTLENLTLGFSKGYCTISGRNNAGKSGIIRLLTNVFGENRNRPWDIKEFDYKEDKTQWAKEPSQI
jgi:putative ATP-dependent endonuclease of OLD family